MLRLKEIDGGVCAAKGFRASGVHCGMYKEKNRKDLALIVSDTLANAAGVFTKNLVVGAPVVISKEHLKNGKAQAIICNSGNANTCNIDGEINAIKMAEFVSSRFNFETNEVLVSSTGVIGVPLEIENIEGAIPLLISSLDSSVNSALDAANAIMTTDTCVKQIAYEFEIDGKTCHIGGIAKGSGMIHPNMATMLSFITTDVNISPNLLHKALSLCIEDSFNMVSVDGDTSTNDMVLILANGQAENKLIENEGEDFFSFTQALQTTAISLSKSIASDGEGATKLITCHVFNAETKDVARKIAKSVISSSLVKCAMFGCDANWGRILCAIGYSGLEINVNKIGCVLKSNAGEVEVCKGGHGVDFSEEIAKEILSESEIEILIDIDDGTEQATAWGCDLTFDYVHINGDYRS